jgi:hypothetical protein
MSAWVIVSWVFVLLLTAINVFVFLKLKQASEQMLQIAFPGAKNMNEAMMQAQRMMKGMQSRGPGQRGSDAQLKAAMEMLQKMQKR